ncbi:MAG TPA: hypothetical protein VE487_17495, partial [Ilumatobacter sp.]|nr:hypothetical protein [Ilumatobacter sp.]
VAGTRRQQHVYERVRETWRAGAVPLSPLGPEPRAEPVARPAEWEWLRVAVAAVRLSRGRDAAAEEMGPLSLR